MIPIEEIREYAEKLESMEKNIPETTDLNTGGKIALIVAIKEIKSIINKYS